MKRLKLTVAYDGTNYCGWQIQPNGITVEEVLNRALRKLTGEEITVIGASRTDSGAEWNYGGRSAEPCAQKTDRGRDYGHRGKQNRFRGTCPWECGSV